jgi:large subunit ribosomal protein L4
VEAVVEGTVPNTKAAQATLRGLSDRKNLLVVLHRSDDVAALSVRNLDDVHTLYADQLNTYDVLVSDDVVFTKDAFESFVAAASKKKQEDAK